MIPVRVVGTMNDKRRYERLRIHFSRTNMHKLYTNKYNKKVCKLLKTMYLISRIYSGIFMKKKTVLYGSYCLTEKGG